MANIYKNREQIIQDTVLGLNKFTSGEAMSVTIDTSTIPLEVNLDVSTEVPSKNTVTTSGTIPSGSKSVTFVTSDDYVGTILGDIAKSNSIYTFSTELNNTLSELVYTVTAGSIEILEVR